MSNSQSNKTPYQIRRHFSISEEFADVVEILDSLPKGTMSRFVCEAILHYNDVKNDPDWLIRRLEAMIEFQSKVLNTASEIQKDGTLIHSASTQDNVLKQKVNEIYEKEIEVTDKVLNKESIKEQNEEVEVIDISIATEKVDGVLNEEPEKQQEYSVQENRGHNKVSGNEIQRGFMRRASQQKK